MEKINSSVKDIPDIVLDSGVTIDELISQYDTVLNDAAKHRANITNKVSKAIDNLNLDPNGDPELLEAQIKLIDTGDKLVQSREKAFLSRIQMRVKHQEADTQSKAMAAMTTKILMELDANKISPYIANQTEIIDVEAMERIDKQLESMEMIGFDEGEIREDSKNLD